ncbi:hypothetical protein PVAND_001716 [Polypedilum vanderplanki]|uniref:G-protein coupled receptors family 3 profile domain-containing protein n=1 Tax=Polypedilum vanderplanki TaxID=319348 RepID=A0A9J6BP19_POLVA|nr:hypothetical protein PVAND_001716 [Polypedilum vanderplanki]
MLLLAFVLLFFISTNVIECQRPSSGGRMDVYIAGFFPYGDRVENADIGRGVMPSVKLALDHVNEHSTILRNYRLHMWWNDTECNAAVGVKSFFDMMHSGPHKLMLFGAACTHVTDPIAKASKHWHLTQLSYADMHPMFTKDGFPNFFRVVPSETAFNAPRLALLREFNWTRVGTIYQNEPRYALPHNYMVAELDSMGLEVVDTQSFATDVKESLEKLREKDVRIILGNFNEFWARRVFCEAFRLEMYGRAYQWLIMGPSRKDWWKVNDTDCTVDELKQALESTIATDLLPLSTSGDITVSGTTAEEYLKEYNRRRGNEYSRFHGYTYDGIWAVALAIQYVSQKKDSFLQNFHYRDKEWEAVFLEALSNTSFEGVTGPVRFYNNERKASFQLNQFQNGEETKIGEYSSLQSRLDLSRGQPLKWFGRSPPKDRTLRIIEHAQVNLTIYVILASCSVLGIVLAISFLIVNIKFRNQRYIKMSSPHLNNLIIIGCILTYTSIIFLGLDSGLSSVTAFPYICTARAWLLMAGFSLAFGAMFSKTWRVHSIFTDLKLNKKVIKDYQLFMVVGVLLAIDIAIMTTWQVADPFFRMTKQLEPYAHPSLEDVIIVRENEYCQSEQMNIFVGVIYAYKGMLLIFGAFLAWETRNVSIPALNDSKHIGLSVYNVVIMCVMGAAIALVLSDQKDAVFLLISIFIMFCTTVTLILVFVPKIIELKRNPSGVIDKRVRATLRPMSKADRRDSSACELEQKLRDVKSNNCRFRKALMDREAELQALIRKLGQEASNWLEGGTSETEPILKDQGRLSAGPVRRDLPSQTELTSIGSCISSHEDLDNSTPETRKKRVSIQSMQDKNKMSNSISQSKMNVEPKVVSTQTTISSATITTADVKPQQVQAQTPDHKSYVTEMRKELSEASTATPTWSPSHNGHYMDQHEYQTAANLTKFNTHMNMNTSMTLSNTELNNICPHGKGSTKNLNMVEQRRVSMGAAMKGNFVVSQSDLWDTQTLSHAKQHSRHSPRNQQARCPDHTYVNAPLQQQAAQSTPSSSIATTPQHEQYDQNGSPGGISTGSASGMMQRSVSEKNRKHRHKQKIAVCQSETDSEREQRTAQLCAQNRKLTKSHHSHHQSTPNVAPDGMKSHKHRSKSRDHHHHHRSSSNMHGACSESELLDSDTAILPIFRKLLTEKESRYRPSRNGASCPNLLSIKCDIVEYL